MFLKNLEYICIILPQILFEKKLYYYKTTHAIFYSILNPLNINELQFFMCILKPLHLLLLVSLPRKHTIVLFFGLSIWILVTFSSINASRKPFLTYPRLGEIGCTITHSLFLGSPTHLLYWFLDRLVFLFQLSL